MTEMQLRKTAGKCASAPRWRRNLFWAIAGAILGILLPALIDYLKPQLWEGFTHARQYLEEGNKLRGEAVREGSEAKHKAANAAFERSWAAGRGGGAGAARDRALLWLGWLCPELGARSQQAY